jgi:peptide deformylase
MLDLMHEAPGVGLAAPQVGLPIRLFVANATGEEEDDMVFINPVITVDGKATEDMEEGCLSLPGINASIRRPKAVTIEATDINGNRFIASSDDLPARIWQHENDHLDGVLIIDKMSPIDKMANRKAIKEMEE